MSSRDESEVLAALDRLHACIIGAVIPSEKDLKNLKLITEQAKLILLLSIYNKLS